MRNTRIVSVFAGAILLTTLSISMTACSGRFFNTGKSSDNKEVIVFAAASLTSSMEKLEKSYEEKHHDVDIILNTDSSGKLMTQIKEGAPCDIFFSAGKSQMDELEEEGLLIAGTRTDVLNNQLVVITYPGSKTGVTGLENISQANSIALADGSVPVGKYTRKALMNLGILDAIEDPSTYTTEDISKFLGGVEISEQSNVSKVLTAVEEGSCEVGTTYLSDTVGHEDKVMILQTVSYDVAGDIIYPAARVVNKDQQDAGEKAADEFYQYLLGDDAKQVYQLYGFDIVG